MGFGKGGVQKPSGKGKGTRVEKNKKKRMEKDAEYSRQERTDNRRGGSGPKLSEREEQGLLELNEEMIRTYVAVCYIARFDEPPKEEWREIIAEIHKEVPAKKSTIQGIFERLADDRTTLDEVLKRKAGSGRKRKLSPDNPGLCAAAIALNSGISQTMATMTCNQENKRRKPNDPMHVSHPTLMAMI